MSTKNDFRRWMQLCESTTLTEAVLDFASASIAREHNAYSMSFDISGGGYVAIDVAVHKNTLYVRNICTLGASDNPESYEPSNTSYRFGVRLGAGQTRRLLNFVVDRIREDYPNVDKILGDRVTGSRADTDWGFTQLNLGRRQMAVTEAKVPLEMLPAKLFHGARRQYVKSILAHGLQPPDFVASGRKNSALRPVIGRVYMSQNAKEAVKYGKHLFVVNRESIVGDLIPDEDAVGEIYHWIMQKDFTDLEKTRQIQGEDSDHTRLMELLNQPDQQRNVSRFKYFMSQTLSKTATLHRNLLFGEYDAWAKGGKKALKTMPETLMLWLISIGVHVSHEGPVIPDEAWVIHTNGLLPDGSNLSEVATRLNYDKTAITPMPPKGPPLKFDVTFEWNANCLTPNDRPGTPERPEKFKRRTVVFTAPSEAEAREEAEVYIDRTVKAAGYRIVSITRKN